MKHIVVVAPGGRRGRGGMCRMVDRMLQEWQEACRQPELLLVDSTGIGPRWRMPFCFAAAFLRILGLGLTGRMALLHLHCAERGSVMRKGILLLLGKLLGAKVVLHMHGAEFQPFYDGLAAPLRATLRWVVRRADSIVVLGTAWQTYYVGHLGLCADKVLVAHNGVDLPAAPAAAHNTCRLLFAGVLGERKGLGDLLAALDDARLQPLGWWLDVAGNGDPTPFRRQAMARNLVGRVRFHGWLPPSEMTSLMQGADILVLPSHHEGLPLVVLEAMAHGLAVVTTPVGSVQDAVVDGSTGLLVPPGDPAALAGVLAQLMAEPDLRRRIGCAARVHVARGFTVRRQNETLQAIFAPLLTPLPR
jgi:glycosyltransferase involved in cell wall biosynthesis